MIFFAEDTQQDRWCTASMRIKRFTQIIWPTYSRIARHSKHKHSFG